MKPISILATGLSLLGIQGVVAQEFASLPQSCSEFPEDGAYTPTDKLPDPFLKADGTRVSSLQEWSCKRSEIRDQLQKWELGPKPPKPTVTATMSGNTISITCSEAGKSISFSVTVKLPSGVGGPYPAMIGYVGGSIPYPADMAVISYNNQDIAVDNPHGRGKFYDLYGSSHAAGGLIAWAWGVSRIIDALELLGSTKTNIDLMRLGVTGCSRNGKGALIAGAFDDRIALTIPQEGGSGGPGCWRIVNSMKSNGDKVEDSTQIVTGDGWFTPSFIQTANDVDVLPYDHHMLMALVAPRALLVIENSGILYLGPPSTYGCSSAAKEVYNALGVDDNMGFSQASHGNSHCQLPASQSPDVTAFYDKFFFNKTATTGFLKTDGNFKSDSDSWTPWTLPVLS